MHDYIYLLLSCCVAYSLEQRVAPGVAPQHYQQPPPPQHQQQFQQQQYQQPQQFQQQPQHQQQQQQFQQQIPVQQQVPMQQQHQVPMQQQHQVPVQQQHIPVQQQIPNHQPGIHSPHPHQVAPNQILNAANMEHEKEHLSEHLNVNIDTSKMSEQELQFHYFKMHDADNNNKLDGCELIKSLIHWHGDGDDKEGTKKGPVQTDNELELLVDPLLQEIDENNDGFVDYAEYKKSEEKHIK